MSKARSDVVNDLRSKLSGIGLSVNFSIFDDHEKIGQRSEARESIISQLEERGMKREDAVVISERAVGVGWSQAAALSEDWRRLTPRGANFRLKEKLRFLESYHKSGVEGE